MELCALFCTVMFKGLFLCDRQFAVSESFVSVTVLDFFRQFSCLFSAVAHRMRFCADSSARQHRNLGRAFCVQRAQQPFHLRRLQSKNGKQQVPLSTATVSMVHSVPELMVSSEVSRRGAECLGSNLRAAWRVRVARQLRGCHRF